jgi:hypothetical protein
MKRKIRNDRNFEKIARKIHGEVQSLKETERTSEKAKGRPKDADTSLSTVCTPYVSFVLSDESQCNRQRNARGVMNQETTCQDPRHFDQEIVLRVETRELRERENGREGKADVSRKQNKRCPPSQAVGPRRRVTRDAESHSTFATQWLDMDLLQYNSRHSTILFWNLQNLRSAFDGQIHRDFTLNLSPTIQVYRRTVPTEINNVNT